MSPVRRLLLLTAALVALLALAACRDDKDVKSVNPDNSSTQASPTALAALPEGNKEQTIKIQNAQIDTDLLKLIANSPTVLHVDNQDTVAYTLSIGDLVANTPIPPRQITDVSFTTTDTGEYTLELFGQGATSPVASVQVHVETAGNTAPVP